MLAVRLVSVASVVTALLFLTAASQSDAKQTLKKFPKVPGANPLGGAQPAKAESPKTDEKSNKKNDKKGDEPGVMEVRFEDDSTMKLKLLDEKIELVTKHGVLRFAPADIRKIELATRIPADVAQKVQAAIAKLNDPDFNTRQAATEELKGYRELAYPAILKAVKSEDTETAQRAEEIAKYIRGKVPEERLKFREFDVIVTDDSKNSGKITGDILHVSSTHFGEQKVKLSDIVLIRSPNGEKEDDVVAIAAPHTLLNYGNQVGKEFVFSVTGGVGGVVYGDGPYTLDSQFSTVVVHAGLAKNGETVKVRVKILGQVAGYASTTRNGVTSNGYGPYPGFEFVKK